MQGLQVGSVPWFCEQAYIQVYGVGQDDSAGMEGAAEWQLVALGQVISRQPSSSRRSDYFDWSP
jgi:hypothetical protein